MGQTTPTQQTFNKSLKTVNAFLKLDVGMGSQVKHPFNSVANCKFHHPIHTRNYVNVGYFLLSHQWGATKAKPNVNLPM